ncbi:hypothetical protein DXA98_11245 [Lachnospiraceae bacterium OF09-6]|nr:hypothetical protein DXA98_11245 [Lachnospiraceae bacterium OF09-6]
MRYFTYQYPKQILTIEQQVQSYIDLGMKITSQEDVEKALKSIGFYNRTIHTTPEILDVDKITPPPAHNGLYQILLAMKYLRLSDEKWTVFVNAFDKLIQNNNGVVSLAAMNLPADWKEHPPFTYDCTIRT